MRTAPRAGRILLLLLLAASAACKVAEISPAAATPPPPPPPPPPPVITVSITPAAPAPDACGEVAFLATVDGTTDQRVTWGIQEGASGGTITATGAYTAPASSGTYHVVATSVADDQASQAVPVAVGPERVLSVAVTPQEVSLSPGEAQVFTAHVTTTCGTSVATQLLTAPPAAAD